ncbi:MAG: MotA/TolQ/ExbB proton channel family protein [Pseudomonadota bacterium]|nr:MotA/TolQ/ExbB proton channel family protein [Pseudomonadota bacterium]
MLEQKMLQFALFGAGWVLWLLVGLSVIVMTIAVERVIYMVLNTAPRAAFEAAIGGFLGGGSREELEKSLTGMRGLEPRVLLAALTAAKKSPDAAEDALVGTLTFEKLRLERFLIIIGTVASNAPFIGLFGTVLGIIQAFNDLALSTEESAGAVMAGISEALVATAVGLVVAIPAVVLYNYFSRRIRESTGRMESLGSLVLSRLRADEAA